MSSFLDFKEYPSKNNIETGGEQEEGYPTDVPGVNSDDIVKIGKEQYPIFDTDSRTFYSSAEANRKRIRVPSGSKIQQYMQNTKYSRPFYLRTTDDNGKQYIKRVK